LRDFVFILFMVRYGQFWLVTTHRTTHRYY